MIVGPAIVEPRDSIKLFIESEARLALQLSPPLLFRFLVISLSISSWAWVARIFTSNSPENGFLSLIRLANDSKPKLRDAFLLLATHAPIVDIALIRLCSHTLSIMPPGTYMAPSGGLEPEMVDFPSLPRASPDGSAIQSSPLSTSSRKRTRSFLSAEESVSSDEEVANYEDQAFQGVRKLKKELAPQVLTGVRLPGLIYPESMYRDYDALEFINKEAEEDVLRHVLVSHCLAA